MGDVQTITGEVTANLGNLVDVAVRFTNQRDEEAVKTTATIALPEAGRLAMYPAVPDDIAQEAAAMMARHWELGRK